MNSWFFFPISDKVQNVRIDLDNKKVFVTSSELSADQLLEAIKKTGKTTNYVGLANWVFWLHVQISKFVIRWNLTEWKRYLVVQCFH